MLEPVTLNIMKWIDALRPSCGIVTVLLLISGFNIIKQPVNPYIALAIFCITSTAMLWNDLYDREIDLNKGKILASQYPNKFFYYSLFLTTVSFIFSTIVIASDLFSGLLCFALLAVSIIYNYIQNVPVVKNLSISFSTGAILLFPMFKFGNNVVLWAMIFIVILVVSAREYIKDVEDMEIDRNKKQTLALIINDQMRTKEVKRWKLILTILIIIISLFGFLY